MVFVQIIFKITLNFLNLLTFFYTFLYEILSQNFNEIIDYWDTFATDIFNRIEQKSGEISGI